MSTVNVAKITTPSTPASNKGLYYYDNTLSPARPTFMDENGTKYPLTPTTVKLTGDLGAVTSTTLTDTTGLAFSVVSGTYYRFEFYIVFRTANTSSGLKVGLTYPSATIAAAHAQIPIAADGTAADFGGQITSSGDSVVGTGVEATNTDYLAVVRGTILPSANGTLQVQHARGGSSANNVTVKQGTHGVLTLIN